MIVRDVVLDEEFPKIQKVKRNGNVVDIRIVYRDGRIISFDKVGLIGAFLEESECQKYERRSVDLDDIHLTCFSPVVPIMFYGELEEVEYEE